MIRTERNPTVIARWPAVWFAALMLLTIWVRVGDPTGWLGSDDTAYHVGAEHLLTGQTIERYHCHVARLAMIVPVAASTALLGESPATVALPTLVASVVCVALIAILGRLVWGWWEGLCAASLVSVLPYFRVLSTTAYPDVHACMWSTLALVLAITAARRNRLPAATTLGVMCGLAIGLAASVKIFSVVALIAVVWFVLMHPTHLRRGRVIVLTSIAAGGLFYIVLDGMFYTWAAGDFWFKLHALQATNAIEGLFSSEPYTLADYAALAWTRLGFLFHTATSGWGRIGVMFWPVVLGILLFNRLGRPLAMWGIAVYLVVAVVPVNFRYGLHPYPVFDGRHILPACIPFALCLSRLLRRAATSVCRPAWVDTGWPVVAAAIVALAFVGRHELNSFRDRPTSRVGVAISRMIACSDFDEHDRIFMPPSLYLRYRILFPPELRPRLRVAVSGDSPSWWRTSSVDIASRCEALPRPSEAYLIVTPTQLSGGFEPWDYGVRLPLQALADYRSIAPTVCIARFEDKSIGPKDPASSSGEPLLVLVSGGAKGVWYSQNSRHEPVVDR